MRFEYWSAVGCAATRIQVREVERQRIDAVRCERADDALHPGVIFAGTSAMSEDDSHVEVKHFTRRH